jgi:hypothetical protein
LSRAKGFGNAGSKPVPFAEKKTAKDAALEKFDPCH